MRSVGSEQRDQDGAILLVVLILAVTFALLGIALTSTVEVSVRARSNADAIARADRAAVSGVEWAAAAVMTAGMFDADRTLSLDAGTRAVVSIRVSRAPQVVSAGRCNGAEVTIGADLQLTDGAPLPFAYASFNAQSRFDHSVTVNGSAYFGDSVRPLATGLVPLAMNGDLFLHTSNVLAAGVVTHLSGVNRYGVARLDEPGVSMAPYLALPGDDVPVYRYTGSTEIANRTVNGVIIVDLDLGLLQHLTLRDAVINGTIVVRGLLPLLPLGLTTPEVRIVGATTINGGTARTGNLALLAPDADLKAGSSTGSVVSGVTFVKQCEAMRLVTFEGQLLTKQATVSTSGPYLIDRPAEFRPDVPLGVDWPGPASVRIVWRGRQ